MRISKKKTLIILVAVLLLGTFLRFYKLGELSFSADEFLGVNVAYGYLQTGEWKRWDFNFDKLADDKAYFKTFFDFDFWGGGEDTYTRAWIYNWQVVQALKFLPAGGESVYRIVSAFWGVITILVVYYVTKAFTGNKIISLISAFLFAVSPDGIIFDRKIRMYAMFLPVFLLFSYFVYQFFESRKFFGSESANKIKALTGVNIMYLIPVILLGLLSLHLHLLSVNIIPALLLYFLILALWEFENNKIFLNRYTVYILLASISIGLFFTLYSDALNLLKSFVSFNNHFSYMEKIFSDYADKMLALILMVTGAIYLFKKKIKAGVYVSSSFLAIFLMAVFFWNRNAGEQYIFFLKPFQIILLAAGIYFAAGFIGNNFKRYGKKVYLASLLVMLLLLPNYAYFFQENNVYRQNSKSDHPNYRKVFDYFLKKRNAEDVLITRNFRNYYFAGAQVDLVTFGGERNEKETRELTKKRLKKIREENPLGWIIWSENDENFISKNAEKYMDEELTRVSNSEVRGKVMISRWEDE